MLKHASGGDGYATRSAPLVIIPVSIGMLNTTEPPQEAGDGVNQDRCGCATKTEDNGYDAAKNGPTKSTTLKANRSSDKSKLPIICLPQVLESLVIEPENYRIGSVSQRRNICQLL